MTTAEARCLIIPCASSGRRSRTFALLTSWASMATAFALFNPGLNKASAEQNLPIHRSTYPRYTATWLPFSNPNSVLH